MASSESKMIKNMIRQADLWNKPLNEVRNTLEMIGGELPRMEGIEISRLSIGKCHLELFSPENAPSGKILVYFHGGGYCLGIYNTNRQFVAQIAKEIGVRLLLIDYRLAPENPYPAAIEDAQDAYRWLLSEDYHPENMVFIGDSSGCGLALIVLNSLRDNQKSLPAGLVCLSPTVDLNKTGESITTRAQVDPYQIKPEFFIDLNYTNNLNVISPTISPLYADLHDLPSTLIHAADEDIFLSDAIRLADKMWQANNNVSIKIWPEMWHIFQMSGDHLPEARQALQEIYEFIDELLK
jgi:acetyl esterase/lipase